MASGKVLILYLLIAVGVCVLTYFHLISQQRSIHVIFSQTRLDQQWAERQKQIRSHICHLKTSDLTLYQDSTCLSLSLDKPNVLVMGDSHAADLYVALSKTYPEIHFLQTTAAGCEFEVSKEKTCERLMEHALAFAKKHPLQAVIVAARWNADSYKSTLLNSTLTALIHARQNVILVGPPLEFKDSVSTILKTMPEGTDPNQFMAAFFNPDKNAISESLAQLAQRLSIHYFNRIEAYCPAPALCPVTDGKNAFISDYGHLTPEGIVYFGKQLQLQGIILRHMSD